MPAGTKKNLRSQKNKQMAHKSGAEKKKEGSFRVISGSWRSRRLYFPVIEGLRPTTDRVKETVFSWLASYIEDAKVLDLFAGSGSLGFEALSRGAASLTAIERDGSAVNAIRANMLLLLGEQSQKAEVIQTDAIKWLQSFSETMTEHYDVVFLDPPFRKAILAPCLEKLSKSGILRAGSWVYLEREKENNTLVLPADWHLLKEKVAGQVCYQLYRLNDERVDST